MQILTHYALMGIIATLALYGTDVCLNAFPVFGGYLGAAIPGCFAALAFLLGRLSRL